MEHTTFNNFGDLYRAAFAEQDPEKKLFLLTQVRKALDHWEEEASRFPGEKPKPPAMVTTFSPPTGLGSKQIA